MKDMIIIAFRLILVIALAIGLLFGIVFTWQSLKIYVAKSTGQAELVRAESNRQIIVREAQARKEAANYNKETSIIEAEAVKEANDIIQEGLGGAEGYLNFLWIQAISKEGNAPSVIYIPTEANLPILEAGKR